VAVVIVEDIIVMIMIQMMILVVLDSSCSATKRITRFIVFLSSNGIVIFW